MASFLLKSQHAIVHAWLYAAYSLAAVSCSLTQALYFTSVVILYPSSRHLLYSAISAAVN